MKRIRHYRLRKGPLGKGRVLEVDLIEVEVQGVSTEGLGYLVPFRAGLEGQPLQESTRTALPVSRERAERILVRELNRRREEGYVDVESVDPTGSFAPEAELEEGPPEHDDRAATLLAYMQQPGFAPPGRKRTRIVRRVGELRIHAAIPALVTELGVARGLHRILVAWSLARVASPECAGALRTLAKDDSEPVRRFALAGLLDIPSEAEAARTAILDDLPSRFARTLDDPEALAAAIDTVVNSNHPESVLALVQLALLNTDTVRAALIPRLSTLSARPPLWRALRRIYKLAELRDDGEMFGPIASTVEHSYGQPGTSWGVTWTREAGRVRITDQIRAGSNRWGFTVPTRHWFRKRTIRILRSRGYDCSPAFIDLAMGILAAANRKNGGGRATRFILQGNRYNLYVSNHLDRHHGHEVPRPARDRHEAFPELWDARPDALVKLALGGYTDKGIEVGCVALRDRPDLAQLLTVEQVRDFVAGATPQQRALGLQAARALWNAADPDLALLVVLADSPDTTARSLAHGWMRAVTRHILADAPVLVALLTSPQDSTRAAAAELVPAARTVPGIEAKLVTGLLDHLAALPHTDPDPHTEVVADVRAVLVGTLADVLRVWPYTALARLFDTPRQDVRRLGAVLLEALVLPADQLPAELLARWTAHADPEVRKLGIRVFGRMPDPFLVERSSVLMAMLTSPVPEVRAAIAPTIARLSGSAGFAGDFFALLHDLLFRDDLAEDIQAELVAFARDHLAGPIAALDSKAVFRLLDSARPAAQTLGSRCLGTLRPALLTPREVVALADHDMRLVRATAQAWIEADAARICAEDIQLLRLIDASWPDTRALGERLLRELRPPDTLDPALLVAICDSPRAEVQALGRGLIPQLFQREHGPLLLARLAEHPSVLMQQFVSGLLHAQAAGHSDRIRSLAPYFAAVLGGVSRGGVAKARVFDFLGKELTRDPELVSWALPLLERSTGSCSVQDRARAIAILSKARRLHGVESGVVTVVAPTHRGEASHGV